MEGFYPADCVPQIERESTAKNAANNKSNLNSPLYSAHLLSLDTMPIVLTTLHLDAFPTPEAASDSSGRKPNRWKIWAVKLSFNPRCCVWTGQNRGSATGIDLNRKPPNLGRSSIHAALGCIGAVEASARRPPAIYEPPYCLSVLAH
jgi:hypothetical protein